MCCPMIACESFPLSEERGVRSGGAAHKNIAAPRSINNGDARALLFTPTFGRRCHEGADRYEKDFSLCSK